MSVSTYSTILYISIIVIISVLLKLLGTLIMCYYKLANHVVLLITFCHFN